MHRPATPDSSQSHGRASQSDRLLDDLARQQQIRPVDDLRALRGDFWPDNEDPDELIAETRRLRHLDLPNGS